MTSASPSPERPVDTIRNRFLFANAGNLLHNKLAFLCRLEESYGPVVSLRIGAKKWLVIQDPDMIRHVLQASPECYEKRGGYRLFQEFLGSSIATSNAAVWQAKRSGLAPAFHRSTVDRVFHHINAETLNLIGRWRQNVQEPVCLRTELLKLTLQNVSALLLGVDLSNRAPTFLSLIEEMTASAFDWRSMLLPPWIPAPATRRFMTARKAFDQIIHSLITQRQRMLQDNPEANPEDWLGMVLKMQDVKDKAGHSAQSLRDEITTLLMVGHETTAQVLSWLLYEAARQPELVRKAREEFEPVSAGGSLTVEHFDNLPFTEALINETIRMYPPVWAITRYCVQANSFAGFTVPANTSVLLNVYGIHHSGRYWQNPGHFFPGHFVNEEGERIRSKAFFAFGGGPRTCIGTHFANVVMRVVFCQLLANFDFVLPPGFSLTPQPSITLRPKEELKVTIAERTPWKSEQL